MLEKIKTVLKWIVLPLTLLFGWIFYLIERINSLKSDVGRAKAEQAISKTLDKLEEQKHDADTKEAEFNNAYSDYERVRNEQRKSGLPDDTK